MYKRKIEPPYIPKLNGKKDLKYFDVMHLNDSLKGSQYSKLNSMVQNEFKNFTFVNQNSIAGNKDSLISHYNNNNIKNSLVFGSKTSMNKKSY